MLPQMTSLPWLWIFFSLFIYCMFLFFYLSMFSFYLDSSFGKNCLVKGIVLPW
nr:ATP synthase F0 subunit 8 [Scatoglyphus polytrematus]